MPLPEIRHRFRHECSLPEEEKVYKLATPYDNRWTKITNYFKDKIVVSRYGESRRYLRSYKEFLSAKKRHIMVPQYRYIIHPMSSFSRVRTVIVAVLWFVMIHWDFCLGSFFAKELLNGTFPVLNTLHPVMNFIFLLDVISLFFTGYTVEKTRSIVMEHDQIIHNYFKTYFVVDVAPIVGSLVFSTLPEDYEKTRWLFYQLHFFRMVRLRTIITKFEHILTTFKIHDPGRILAMLAFTCHMIVYVLTSVSNIIRVIQILYRIKSPDHLVKLYEIKFPHSSVAVRKGTLMRGVDLFAIHFSAVMYHFVGVTSSKIAIKNSIQQMYFTMVINIGLCFYLYSVAKILQFYSVKNLSEASYDDLIVQADAFMVQKSFKQKLKTRIFEYYNYKYHKKFFSENTILGTFSEHLQMEVLLYSCQHLIDTVQMFKGLSKAAIGSILALLKQETYVPGDKILSPQNADGCVYFILFGTCGIFLENDKEVLHIEDGDYFGYSSEEDSWSGCNFDYKVVALEMANVYKLEPHDVKYCCKRFPEVLAKLEAMENQRTRKYNKMYDLTMEDDDDRMDDILAELRKGRILAGELQRVQFMSSPF